MKNNHFIFLFLLINYSTIAQQNIDLYKATDCSNAIQITDTILIYHPSPKDSANVLEVWGNTTKDSMYFEQEHHTVWYWFKIPHNAKLTFEIIPLAVTDDYDFMLFKFTDKNFCSDVREKKLLPIRSCISRNDKRIKSMTGLSLNANRQFVGQGIGESFTKALSVQTGEIYFLLVDNVYENGKGHKIYLHYLPSNALELEVGQSLIFENIEFKYSSEEFEETSYPSLDSLFHIVKNNPTVKIEIQGHVDRPGETNSKWIQTLSEKRGFAVFMYLVRQGISGKRLRYRGYGNSQPLFESPSTEEEHKKNRRVEIKILSL